MGETYPCVDLVRGGNIPLMSGINRERLKELIKERGETPRSVSRKIGPNAYLVRDILSSKSQNARADTIAKIADVLQVPQSAFMSSAGVGEEPTAYDARQVQIVPRFLHVRYKVQAGNWVETDAQEPPEPITFGVAPDARYANWQQWLELVVGDSVNMKIQPGHYAHVVDAIDMGYSPRTGDWVVVERRRGAVRERTIKQVEIGPRGTVTLHPRSTNPRWREPVVVNAGAEDEEIYVEIVGKVIGSYDPNY
jgi:transcriptional regulator with XRE-family HTH domain